MEVVDMTGGETIVTGPITHRILEAGSHTFSGEDDTITAHPGTLVTAPAGTAHGFANPGGQPAVILATVTPDFYIDFFRELANLRPGPSGLDPEEVAEIMARYATEVVRPAYHRG